MRGTHYSQPAEIQVLEFCRIWICYPFLSYSSELNIYSRADLMGVDFGKSRSNDLKLNIGLKLFVECEWFGQLRNRIKCWIKYITSSANSSLQSTRADSLNKYVCTYRIWRNSLLKYHFILLSPFTAKNNDVIIRKRSLNDSIIIS